MLYNKREVRKVNDKKVLHKVKKQWVTISLALLMAIGGGAAATHVNASANKNTGDNSGNTEITRINNNLKQTGDNHSELYNARNTARIGDDNGQRNKPVYSIGTPKLPTASDYATAAGKDSTAANSDSTTAANSSKAINQDQTDINTDITSASALYNLESALSTSSDDYKNYNTNLNTDATTAKAMVNTANANETSISGEVTTIAQDATDASNAASNNKVNAASDANTSASDVLNHSIISQSNKISSAKGTANQANQAATATMSAVNDAISKLRTSVINKISDEADAAEGSAKATNALSGSASTSANEAKNDSVASSASTQASYYSNESANETMVGFVNAVNGDKGQITNDSNSIANSATDASNKYNDIQQQLANAKNSESNDSALASALSVANADLANVNTDYSTVSSASGDINKKSSGIKTSDTDAQGKLSSLRTSAVAQIANDSKSAGSVTNADKASTSAKGGYTSASNSYDDAINMSNDVADYSSADANAAVSEDVTKASTAKGVIDANSQAISTSDADAHSKSGDITTQSQNASKASASNNDSNLAKALDAANDDNSGIQADSKAIDTSSGAISTQSNNVNGDYTDASTTLNSLRNAVSEQISNDSSEASNSAVKAGNLSTSANTESNKANTVNDQAINDSKAGANYKDNTASNASLSADATAASTANSKILAEHQNISNSAKSASNAATRASEENSKVASDSQAHHDKAMASEWSAANSDSTAASSAYVAVSNSESAISANSNQVTNANASAQGTLNNMRDSASDAIAKDSTSASTSSVITATNSKAAGTNSTAADNSSDETSKLSNSGLSYANTSANNDFNNYASDAARSKASIDTDALTISTADADTSKAAKDAANQETNVKRDKSNDPSLASDLSAASSDASVTASASSVASSLSAVISTKSTDISNDASNANSLYTSVSSSAASRSASASLSAGSTFTEASSYNNSSNAITNDDSAVSASDSIADVITSDATAYASDDATKKTSSSISSLATRADDDTSAFNKNQASANSIFAIISSANSVAQQNEASADSATSKRSFSAAYSYENAVNSAYERASDEASNYTSYVNAANSASSDLKSTTSSAQSLYDGMSHLIVDSSNDSNHTIDSNNFDDTIVLHDNKGPYAYAIQGTKGGSISLPNGQTYDDLQVNSQTGEVTGKLNGQGNLVDLNYAASTVEAPRTWLTNGNNTVTPEVKFYYNEGDGSKTQDTDFQGLNVNTADEDKSNGTIRLPTNISGYKGEPYYLPIDDFYDPSKNLYPHFTPTSDDPKATLGPVVLGVNYGNPNDSNNNNGNYDTYKNSNTISYWYGSRENNNGRQYTLEARRYWTTITYSYTDNNNHTTDYTVKYDANSMQNNPNIHRDQNGDALFGGLTDASVDINSPYSHAGIPNGLGIANPNEGYQFLNTDSNVSGQHTYSNSNYEGYIDPNKQNNANNGNGNVTSTPSGNDPQGSIDGDQTHPSNLDIPLHATQQTVTVPAMLQSSNNAGSSNQLTPVTITLYNTLYDKPNTYWISRGSFNYYNPQDPQNFYMPNNSSVLYGQHFVSGGRMNNTTGINNDQLTDFWNDLDNIDTSNTGYVNNPNFSNVGSVQEYVNVSNGQIVPSNQSNNSNVKLEQVPVFYYEPYKAGTYNEYLTIPDVYYTYRLWRPGKRDQADIDGENGYNTHFVNNDLKTNIAGDGISIYSDTNNNDSSNYINNYDNSKNYTNTPYPYNAVNIQTYRKNMTYDQGLSQDMVPSGSIIQQQPYLWGNLGGFHAEDTNLPENNWMIRFIKTGKDVSGDIQLQFLNVTKGSNGNQIITTDLSKVHGQQRTVNFLGLVNGNNNGNNSLVETPNSDGFDINYNNHDYGIFPRDVALLVDNDTGRLCTYVSATDKDNKVTDYNNSSASTATPGDTINGYYVYPYTSGNPTDNPVHFKIEKTLGTSSKDQYKNGNSTNSYHDGSGDHFYIGDMNAYAQPMPYKLAYLGSQNYLNYDGQGINEQNGFPNPTDKDGNNDQFYPNFTQNTWSFDPYTADKNSTDYYNDLAYAGDYITYQSTNNGTEGRFYIDRLDDNGQTQVNLDKDNGHGNAPAQTNVDQTPLLAFPTYNGQTKQSYSPHLTYDGAYEQSYLNILKQDEEDQNHYISQDMSNSNGDSNNTGNQNKVTLNWTLGYGNLPLNVWPDGAQIPGDSSDPTAIVYLADQQIKAQNEIHFVDLDTGYQFSEKKLQGANGGSLSTLFNNVQKDVSGKSGNKSEFDMAGFLAGIANEKTSTLNTDGTWKLETTLDNGDNADVYIVRTDSPSSIEPVNNTFIYVSTVDIGSPREVGSGAFPLTFRYEDTTGNPIAPDSTASSNVSLTAAQSEMQSYAISAYSAAAMSAYNSQSNAYSQSVSNSKNNHSNGSSIASPTYPKIPSSMGSMAGQYDFLVDGPLGNTILDTINGDLTKTKFNNSASSFATYFNQKGSSNPLWNYTEDGYHEVYLIPGMYRADEQSNYSNNTSNLNRDATNEIVNGKPVFIDSAQPSSAESVGEVGYTPVVTAVLAKNPQVQPYYVYQAHGGDQLIPLNNGVEAPNDANPVTVAGNVGSADGDIQSNGNIDIRPGTPFYNTLKLNSYENANTSAITNDSTYNDKSTSLINVNSAYAGPQPVYVTAPGINVHYQILGQNSDLNAPIYFNNPGPNSSFDINNYSDGTNASSDANWADLNNLRAHESNSADSGLPSGYSTSFDSEHYSIVATVGSSMASLPANANSEVAPASEFTYSQQNVYIYLVPKAYAQVHFIDDTAKDGVKDPNDKDLSNYDPQSLMTTSGSSATYNPSASLNALSAAGYQLDPNPVSAGSNNNGSNKISFSYGVSGNSSFGNSYTNNSTPYVYNIYVEHKSTAMSSGDSVNEEIHYSFATSANNSSLNDSGSITSASNSLPTSYRNSVSYNNSYNVDDIESSSYDFRWSSNGSFSNVPVSSISGWHATITSFNGSSYGSYNNDSSVIAPKISYSDTNTSLSGSSFTAASASMSSGIYNYSYDVTYYPDSYSDYASATDVVTYKYLNSNGTLSWSNSSENGSALSYHRSENWLSDSSANAYSATSWSASGASSFASIKPSASVSVSDHWYHLVANSTSSDVPSIPTITSGLKSNSNEPFSNVITYQEDRLSNYVNNASGTATIVYHWENESDSVIPSRNSSKSAGNISYSQSYTSDMNWTGGSSSDWAWSSSANIQFDNSASSESGYHISSAYSGYIPQISNRDEPSANTMNYSEVENIYYIPDSYTTSKQTSQFARGNVTVNYYLNGTSSSVAIPFTSSSAITYTRTVYSDATSGKAGSNYYSYGPWSSNNSVSNIIPTSSSASTQAAYYHLINRNVVTSSLPSLSSVKAGSTYNYVENVYFDADTSSSQSDYASAENTVHYYVSGTNQSVQSDSVQSFAFSRADSYDTFSSGNVNHTTNTHSYGPWMTSSKSEASVSFSINVPRSIESAGYNYHLVTSGTNSSASSIDLGTGSVSNGSVASYSNVIYYAKDNYSNIVNNAAVNKVIEYLSSGDTNSSVASSVTVSSISYVQSEASDTDSSAYNVYGSWTTTGSLSSVASAQVSGMHPTGSNSYSNTYLNSSDLSNGVLRPGSESTIYEYVYYAPDAITSQSDSTTVKNTVNYLSEGTNESMMNPSSDSVIYSRADNYDSYSSAGYENNSHSTGNWSTASQFTSFSIPSYLSSNGSYYHLDPFAIGTNSNLPTANTVSDNDQDSMSNAFLTSNSNYANRLNGSVNINNNVYYAPDSYSNITNTSYAKATITYIGVNEDNTSATFSTASLSDVTFKQSEHSDTNNSQGNHYGSWIAQDSFSIPNSFSSDGWYHYSQAGNVPGFSGNSLNQAANISVGSSYAESIYYKPDSTSSDVVNAVDTIHYVILEHPSDVLSASTSDNTLTFTRSDRSNSDASSTHSYGSWSPSGANSFESVPPQSYLDSDGIHYHLVGSNNYPNDIKVESDALDSVYGNTSSASYDTYYYYMPDNYQASTENATGTITVNYRSQNDPGHIFSTYSSQVDYQRSEFSDVNDSSNVAPEYYAWSADGYTGDILNSLPGSPSISYHHLASDHNGSYDGSADSTNDLPDSFGGAASLSNNGSYAYTLNVYYASDGTVSDSDTVNAFNTVYYYVNTNNGPELLSNSTSTNGLTYSRADSMDSYYKFHSYGSWATNSSFNTVSAASDVSYGGEHYHLAKLPYDKNVSDLTPSVSASALTSAYNSANSDSLNGNVHSTGVVSYSENVYYDLDTPADYNQSVVAQSANASIIVHYVSQGTGTSVSSYTSSISYQRSQYADRYSSGVYSYNAWSANGQHSVPSINIPNGPSSAYLHLASGTGDASGMTDIPRTLSDVSNGASYSYLEDIYYASDNAYPFSQTATVNENVRYIFNDDVFSNGVHQSMSSTSSQTVEYSRSAMYDPYTHSSTVTGSWHVASGSFSIPSSASKSGWYVNSIESGIGSYPNTSSLVPGENSGHTYDVLYNPDNRASQVNASSAYAVINYIQSGSDGYNLYSQATLSALPMSQRENVDPSDASLNASGDWYTTSGFSKPDSLSISNWVPYSSNGTIPSTAFIFATNNVYPFVEDVYYRHDTMASGTSDSAFAEDTVGYYTKSDGHDVSIAPASTSSVEFYRVDNYDQTRNTHSYGTWNYADTFSINAPEYITSNGVNYHIVSDGTNSVAPNVESIAGFSEVSSEVTITTSGDGSSSSYTSMSYGFSYMPSPLRPDSVKGYTNSIYYAPNNTANVVNTSSATATINYVELNITNWGESSIASTATSTIAMQQSENHDGTNHSFNRYGSWVASGFSLPTSMSIADWTLFPTLSNSGSIPTSAFSVASGQPANYVMNVYYVQDPSALGSNVAPATDTVNYLISGTSSAISSASTGMTAYSRSDSYNEVTRAHSYGSWVGNSFASISVPTSISFNGVNYHEVSADSTVPSVTQNALDAYSNGSHSATSYANDIYYAPDSSATSTAVVNGTETITYLLSASGSTQTSSVYQNSVAYSQVYSLDNTTHTSVVTKPWTESGSFVNVTTPSLQYWSADSSMVAAPSMNTSSNASFSYEVIYVHNNAYYQSSAAQSAAISAANSAKTSTANSISASQSASKSASASTSASISTSQSASTSTSNSISASQSASTSASLSASKSASEARAASQKAAESASASSSTPSQSTSESSQSTSSSSSKTASSSASSKAAPAKSAKANGHRAPTSAEINRDITHHHVTSNDADHMTKDQLAKTKRNDPRQYPKVARENKLYHDQLAKAKAKVTKRINKHIRNHHITPTDAVYMNKRQLKQTKKSDPKVYPKVVRYRQQAHVKAINRKLTKLQKRNPAAYKKVVKTATKLAKRITNQPVKTRIYRDVIQHAAKTVTPQQMNYLAVHNPKVYQRIMAEQQMLGINHFTSPLARKAESISAQQMLYLKAHNPSEYRKILAEQQMLGISHMTSKSARNYVNGIDDARRGLKMLSRNAAYVKGYEAFKKANGGKLPQTGETHSHMSLAAAVLMVLSLTFSIPAIKRRKHNE